MTYEKPDRQALQAAGIHPAPCARHCEANAFEIAARGMRKQITELQEALESVRKEPEFFTHSVDTPYDWSEWVCPDPKGYLMKCCDCGLVHETEFGVVRYQSETEREACEMVDDPNLQAVFRMRRSEQWSPLDTAHRAGGLPMEQPAPSQVFGFEIVVDKTMPPDELRLVQSPPAPALPLTDNRMKVKLGSQYGADLEGHWFYLQPADEFAEAALVQRTGITKGGAV